MRLSPVIVASIVMSLVTMSHAEVLPATASLPVSFDAASVVLTGQVTSVEHGAETIGNWNDRRVPLVEFTATIALDGLYKGRVGSPAVKVLYSRPTGNICSVSKCTTMAVGQYGLFFLDDLGNGYYSCDRFSGRLPISRLKSLDHRPGLLGLQSDLLAGLQEQDDTILMTNMELLGGLKDSKAAPPLLEWLARNSNRPARVAAYVALLQLQNYSKIEEMLAFEENFSGGTPSELRLADELINQVSAVRDPTLVPALIAFSNSRSDRVRESVVHALREIASPDAVPVFAAALNDRVQLVRYDAVLGLATVEKRWDFAPSVDTFMASESKYVDFWRSWWLASDHYRR